MSYWPAANSRYEVTEAGKARHRAYVTSPAGRAARRARDIARQERHLERVAPFLADGCADCGSYFRLHFHHRDPSTKLAAVGAMAGYSNAKVRTEIAKCDVVCQPCHKQRHVELGVGVN